MVSYRVEVTKQVRAEIRHLPGYIRPQIFRALKTLQDAPSPAHSQVLDTVKAGIILKAGAKLCRIRISSWRIIYFIEEEWQLISVLAVRKRPPYQYDDLEDLLKNLQD